MITLELLMGELAADATFCAKGFSLSSQAAGANQFLTRTVPRRACPVGTIDNSPAFQRRVGCEQKNKSRRDGRRHAELSRPFWTLQSRYAFPALKRRILETSLRDSLFMMSLKQKYKFL